MERELKVFISYGREDVTNAFAEKLHGDLASRGYNPTLDVKDFRVGVLLAEVIGNKIVDCEIMVVILSKKYSESTWCTDELTLAKNEGKD